MRDDGLIVDLIAFSRWRNDSKKDTKNDDKDVDIESDDSIFDITTNSDIRVRGIGYVDTGGNAVNHSLRSVGIIPIHNKAEFYMPILDDVEREHYNAWSKHIADKDAKTERELSNFLSELELANGNSNYILASTKLVPRTSAEKFIHEIDNPNRISLNSTQYDEVNFIDALNDKEYANHILKNGIIPYNKYYRMRTYIPDYVMFPDNMVNGFCKHGFTSEEIHASKLRKLREHTIYGVSQIPHSIYDYMIPDRYHIRQYGKTREHVEFLDRLERSTNMLYDLCRFYIHGDMIFTVKNRHKMRYLCPDILPPKDTSNPFYIFYNELKDNKPKKNKFKNRK